MKKTVWLVFLVLVVFPVVAHSTDDAVLGSVQALSGDVSIGQGEVWAPAAVGSGLKEGQVLRTGPDSRAEVLFEGDVSAVVSEKTSIEVSDLLLKSRLEKMKGKVSTPADSRKVELEVTPTTGVRGTEQTESKSEELKRDHYWNEKVK